MARSALSALVRNARSGLLLVAILLSACATAFAPPYDPAFVTGFNQANERALVLFSALSGGSGAGAYESYAERYADVIGAFDALKLRAEARPSQELPDEIRSCVCKDPHSDECTINPTPFNLEGLISNLTTMKQRHKSAGLSSGYVQLRKIDHDIYARHVLVVEEFLKSEVR